jgi:hypothetical protein
MWFANIGKSTICERFLVAQALLKGQSKDSRTIVTKK